MSSGIPSLPVAKAEVYDTEEDDNNTIANRVGDDDTDDDLSSNAESDNNDTSSIDATSDTEDDDDDITGAVRAPAEGEAEGEGEGDSSADEAGDGDGDGDGDEDNIVEKLKTKKKSGAAAAASSRRRKNMEDDMTMLGVPHGIHFDDFDDENDDERSDEENKDSSEYFQKLKAGVRESYVETYHPEIMSHNYDEIQTLSRVVRNNAGVIVDDLHRTIPIMTKYEKTRILGQRARQINEGAPAFIKIDTTVIDGYLIAVKELEQKKTPFIIRRPLPNGGSEYWRVQDLEIL